MGGIYAGLVPRNKENDDFFLMKEYILNLYWAVIYFLYKVNVWKIIEMRLVLFESNMYPLPQHTDEECNVTTLPCPLWPYSSRQKMDKILQKPGGGTIFYNTSCQKGRSTTTINMGGCREPIVQGMKHDMCQPTTKIGTSSRGRAITEHKQGGLLEKTDMKGFWLKPVEPVNPLSSWQMYKFSVTNNPYPQDI